MDSDNKIEEESQKARDKYYNKILGDSEISLLEDSKVKQKQILKKEAERLARLVSEEGCSKNVTSDCNKLLAKARKNLEKETPEINEVMDLFDAVKQRLISAYCSRESQPWFFPLITFYNFILLAGFISIIAFYALIPGQKNLESTAFVCLACAMWGGVGGIVDAFFSLHRHLSNQDFDKHYWPWYYLHPILGLSLGAVVFLILQAGLLAVSGLPLQEAASGNTTTVTSGATEVGSIGASALPIAMAFLAGFRQSTAVNYLIRLVRAIFSRSNGENREE